MKITMFRMLMTGMIMIRVTTEPPNATGPTQLTRATALPDIQHKQQHIYNNIQDVYTEL